jgi:UDP-N-acetylmuramoyl-L-alanyl-D-glutamate--2,6-diaminopimelate ligase
LKKLHQILSNISYKKVVGSLDIDIQELKLNSKEIKKDDVFIAIKGTVIDSHKFIDEVIEKGACTIICEVLPDILNQNITYVLVDDARKTTALLANNYFEQPSQKLKLVGVTGTNGKTTIATLLFQLYKNAGYSVGLLSTIENKINNKIIPSTHTTPNPIELNKLLAQMVEAGCEFAFMEVSSHAIHQDRIAGLKFTGAIFSNITHDHLDYHKTFDEYIKAKKKFFDELQNTAFALSNIDDKRGEVMLQNTQAKKYTYAIKSHADFHIKIIENTFSGLVLQYQNQDVYTQLTGRFNAYNLLAVLATCILLGMDSQIALQQISLLKTAEGRFELIKSKENIFGVIDYAHTPDALKNVLDTINAIRTGNENLITIIGCGGNRDKAKRPEMALIASELSNKVILTSDNPRDEEPETILAEMQKGVPPHNYNKVIKITDRKEAINHAYNMAHTNDIILLAGKGHEKYQEIKGIKYPFDDKEILNNILNKKA